MSQVLRVQPEGEARALVGRESAAPPWREAAPTVALWTGVVVGVSLLVAAAVVRVRAGRRSRGAAHPDTGALKVVARAMRLSRGARVGVERLAVLAGVREPAVLVLSEHAFREAAARAVERSAEEGGLVDELARGLGFEVEEDLVSGARG